ncbi:MAG: response regulator [Desulfobacter sp.]|nr:MAG: response regulator [Desulfobacter sp.]
MTTDPRQPDILVMDDEEHIRNITKKMLEKFGYHVSLTADGSEAVHEYRSALDRSAPYALVILDLTIPNGMGGEEAARKILDMDPQARLVVSSGYLDDPVMADYPSYGLKGAIPKPYRLNDLKEMVANLVS